MNREEIPDEVKRFILISIPSVPYLEAILLLRRERDRGWTAGELAQRLYVSAKVAAEVLSGSAAAGIAAIEDTSALVYRYQPASAGLEQMIDRLAAIYAKNLIDVTNLIHSKTSKSAQQFADAFIWRKDG